MKKSILFVFIVFIGISAILYSCKKDVGVNPLLAFSDKALYDSTKNEAAFVYYKNAPTTVYSGTTGPHGPFKLRFNKTATTALTDNGKLPLGQKFPDGSFIVKDAQSSGIVAFMYKKSGSWIWGEANSDGSVAYSVNKDPTTCTSCHNQTGQRDLVVSFNFY